LVRVTRAALVIAAWTQYAPDNSTSLEELDDRFAGRIKPKTT
jgi:hypothetical protein